MLIAHLSQNLRYYQHQRMREIVALFPMPIPVLSLGIMEEGV